MRVRQRWKDNVEKILRGHSAFSSISEGSVMAHHCDFKSGLLSFWTHRIIGLPYELPFRCGHFTQLS